MICDRARPQVICYTTDMQRHNRPYELVPFNEKWKAIFPSEAQLIKISLGDIVKTIEHIGSTSIPSMIAKPQIDILVIVTDLDLVPKYYVQMESVGYTALGREYVGNGDEYFIKDSLDGRRIVSVHIFEEGNPHINKYIYFREYIKQHPLEMEEYVKIKSNLYDKYSDNYAEYDTQKAILMNPLKQRAFDWGIKNL